MPKDVKDIHFQVPTPLYESFYRAFPEHGERKRILTEFVKEAIKLQSLRNYFTQIVAKNVAGNWQGDSSG